MEHYTHVEAYELINGEISTYMVDHITIDN
jgi:hypothetical protein